MQLPYNEVPKTLSSQTNWNSHFDDRHLVSPLWSQPKQSHTCSWHTVTGWPCITKNPDILLEHPHTSASQSLAAILLSVLLTATLRGCWPILARNDQHAPRASQVSSHTLQDSRCDFFLYRRLHRLYRRLYKRLQTVSTLGSSNFTPLFLFHSLLLVMEKLGTRKQTKLEQLQQFLFLYKHLFTQKTMR